MQPPSFDSYARQYDAHFTFSPIGLIQREQVYKQLIPLLSKNKNLLELNCGTGHDAHQLISHLKSVLATDISPEMIAQCISKKSHETPDLRFAVKSVQQIKSELQTANFVFSNFGGLNCLSPDDIKAFAQNCLDETGKDTELFFVVLGRKCVWEKLYFLMKFDLARVFRRKKKIGVATKINENEFSTWYYSPREIEQLFGPAFRAQSCGPIGLFVPPSYLNTFFGNKKLLLRLLGDMDQFFCKFKMLADYGDHFYIHLKKAN
ncbi:MAG: class I SAM-dependent methyltransferase [Bacteroidota bacterium]